MYLYSLEILKLPPSLNFTLLLGYICLPQALFLHTYYLKCGQI